MHADAFDRYEQRESFLHYLDAQTKVVGTVGFILSNVLLPDGAWLGLGLAWILLLIANVASRMGMTYSLRRSFVALPFALPAISMAFTLPGHTVWEGQLGPWLLVATDAGLTRFFSILARSWLSVQMAILLVSTTPFPAVAEALQRLRIPRLIVAIMSLMYRYLFVLADEVVRMLRARDARSARGLGARRPSTFWQAQVAGGMAGQLFLRSYERSDRVYQAMLARGFRGEILTLEAHRLGARDWWLLAGLSIALTAIHGAVRWV